MVNNKNNNINMKSKGTKQQEGLSPPKLQHQGSKTRFYIVILKTLKKHRY